MEISNEDKIKSDTNYYHMLSPLTYPVEVSENINVVKEKKMVRFMLPSRDIKTIINQKWQHKIRNREK